MPNTKTPITQIRNNAHDIYTRRERQQKTHTQITTFTRRKWCIRTTLIYCCRLFVATFSKLIALNYKLCNLYTCSCPYHVATLDICNKLTLSLSHTHSAHKHIGSLVPCRHRSLSLCLSVLALLMLFVRWKFHFTHSPQFHIFLHEIKLSKNSI